MSDRDVMQQALEALNRAVKELRGVTPTQDLNEAIDALRARLAEPQTCKPALQVEGAEPVAWQWLDTATFRRKVPARCNAAEWRPLYTAAPPARRPLTDDEIDRVIDVNWSINNHKPTYVAHRAFARAIERAHKITGGNDE